MPRPIDHLVVAVPDLAGAAALYRVLGFTVGGRNRHPSCSSTAPSSN